jgi:hypothetical protein
MGDRLKLIVTSPGNPIVHLIYRHHGVYMCPCPEAFGYRTTDAPPRSHVTCLLCLYHAADLVAYEQSYTAMDGAATPTHAMLQDNEELVNKRLASRHRRSGVRQDAKSAPSRAAVKRVSGKRGRSKGRSVGPDLGSG